MEDLSGRQLGPYRVLAPLGEGGMAAVYKAYQPGMERLVALKILPRHFASDPEFVGRFRQEARIIASLQHPHILPVHDFGEADGYTYIVMPFVETGTLADLLGGQPLPVDQIRNIISQVGDALDYAHSHGVVHRDVKPSNVLIDERGNCLLTDFGVAKIVEGSAQFTRTGAIIGTPAYMSPEQGLAQKLDSRSDIYALGVMLYEMATGDVPFNAETPMAIVMKQINAPLPLPHNINPALPEAIERVILKSLAKNPEDRFQTAQAMVEALIAASAAGPPDQKTDESPTALRGPRRRSLPASYVLVGVVALAAVAVAISLSIGRGRSVIIRTSAPPEQSMSSTVPGTALQQTLQLPSIVRPAAQSTSAATEALLFDGFDDPAQNSKYDTSLWFCGGCAYASVTQSDAAIRLELTDGVVALNSQSVWSSDNIAYMQGTMKLQDADNGGVNVILRANLASYDWETSCTIQGISKSRAEYTCDVYTYVNGRTKAEYVTESLPVNHDDWHTARIELTPDTLELRFYLDGQLIGEHVPVDAKELRNAFLRVSLGSYTDTHLVAHVDDVLLAPAPTGSSVSPDAAKSTSMPVSLSHHVLFDESHGGLSLDPIRAATLDPYHPEYAYAGILAKEVGKSYTLDSLSKGPITPSVLADHRILILSAPNGWYSPEEADTILNFVRNGGGLLILGVDGAGSQSLITEPVGVGFVGRPIASEQHLDWGPWGFKVDTSSNSGLLAGVSQVTLNADAALEVNSPANAIASTGANTWLDLNQNQVRDTDEQMGPFPFAAQAQLGRGRVVIFSATVWGSFFYDNMPFVMNALEWLSGG